MTIKPVLIAMMAVLTLAACSSRKTEFSNPVAADVSAGWRLAGVEVVVPDTLTVSEQNTYAPEADIVWHGDSLTLDVSRQRQVAAILKDGITDAGSRMHGRRAVILRATLLQFHALSPIARDTTGGIHNVDFMIGVYDAATGVPIVEPVKIQADEFALCCEAASQAMMRGETQKVRIRNRIKLVVASWLGVALPGEDVVRGAIPSVGR